MANLNYMASLATDKPWQGMLFSKHPVTLVS